MGEDNDVVTIVSSFINKVRRADADKHCLGEASDIIDIINIVMAAFQYAIRRLSRDNKNNAKGDDMNCPICSWSSDDPVYLLLYETNYWRVVLAPNQSLVGRCILDLKRHCGDVAETTQEELSEWGTIVKVMEEALRKAFDATMFNWSCYMNSAYRDQPPEPHVHWWVVPRYNHPVRVGDRIFKDVKFGNPYDHSRILEAPGELHHQIAGQIKEAIAQLVSDGSN